MYFTTEFYCHSGLKVNRLPRIHLSSRLEIWLLEASPYKCPEVVLSKGVNMSEKTDHYTIWEYFYVSVCASGLHPSAIHSSQKQEKATTCSLDLAQCTSDHCMRTLHWEHSRICTNSSYLLETWQDWGRAPSCPLVLVRDTQVHPEPESE